MMYREREKRSPLMKNKGTHRDLNICLMFALKKGRVSVKTTEAPTTRVSTTRVTKPTETPSTTRKEIVTSATQHTNTTTE
jgi:hypothetical protein